MEYYGGGGGTGTGDWTERSTFDAGENLSSGDFVNLYDDAGTIKARKADAALGYKADGFVPSAAVLGAPVIVYAEGTNKYCAALTAATVQYLSAVTPGKTTETPPSGTGELVQRVGDAISTTSIFVELGQPVLLA